MTKAFMRDRRTFVIAVALGILGIPLICPAQSVPKVWRVGYLSPYPSPDDARFEAFREKLRDLGHVEGKTIALEYVSAEGRPDRLPALAAELARRKVDIVLAAGGTPATRAASTVTNTIPIVFAGLADPVGQGFVKTLARPGGNLTGTTTQSPEVAVKALAFFNETLPGAKHVAILSNPTNSWHSRVLSEIHSAAARMNVSVTVVHAKAAAEFETAFAQIMRHRPGGLLIFGDVLFNNEAKTLTTLAAAHRLPTIGMNNFVPDSGGLMSYGANRLDIVRRAAILVDKIIKGAKPADLPVEQPTQFELIVNTNAAKALGIALPQSILVRADRRIE